MLFLDRLQVSEEGLHYSRRKRGVAFLIPLATPNDALILRKVDVLDSQTAALHQTQPHSINEHRHQPCRAAYT